MVPEFVVGWSKTLLLVLLLVDPPDLSSVLPLAPLNLIIFAGKYAEAVLLALAPVTIVPPAILPDEGSSAFTLIVQELTLVALAVPPDEKAVTMHFIFFPLPVIHFSIRPNIFPLPEDFIVLELS